MLNKIKCQSCKSKEMKHIRMHTQKNMNVHIRILTEQVK